MVLFGSWNHARRYLMELGLSSPHRRSFFDVLAMWSEAFGTRHQTDGVAP
jgi:hypothetical protein